MDYFQKKKVRKLGAVFLVLFLVFLGAIFFLPGILFPEPLHSQPAPIQTPVPFPSSFPVASVVLPKAEENPEATQFLVSQLTKGSLLSSPPEQFEVFNNSDDSCLLYIGQFVYIQKAKDLNSETEIAPLFFGEIETGNGVSLPDVFSSGQVLGLKCLDSNDPVKISDLAIVEILESIQE